MDESYPVPAQPVTVDARISKSLFIAHIFHVQNQQHFSDTLNAIRKKHKGASHNCWAHITGSPADSTRWGMSDDGEPKGCAGRPMLHVLSHSGIGEIGAIVTRYYGGVKLGTGGLTRAYSKTVQLGLHNLETITKTPSTFFTLVFPYQLQPAVDQILQRFQADIVEAVYEQAVTFEVSIAKSRALTLFEQLEKLRSTELLITQHNTEPDQTAS